MHRTKIVLFGVGCLGCFSASAYWANVFVGAKKTTTSAAVSSEDTPTSATSGRSPPSPALSRPSKDTFDVLATNYDTAIAHEEKWSGISLLRWWLISRHASGRVLEVAGGTGRNLAHYSPNKVEVVYVSDVSKKMMKTAQQRALDLAGNGAEKKRLLNNPLASLLQVDERNHEGNRDEKGSNGMPYPSYLTSVVASSPSFPARYPVHFVAADVTDLRGVPDGYFDTVVDTFGLCSFDDPVAAVKEMKRVCKPSGQLLLLEHGRSTSWDFMNRHLDAKAEDHRRNWGCWWNREIKTILQRAGVNIADHSTFHFGSTHMIRGKPQ